MHINYIILAHKNPLQLKRLVDRLDEPWVDFFIHVDLQVDIEPFLKITGRRKNVHFLEGRDRELGTWGDIGIVKGTLQAMRKIIKRGSSDGKGYCVLLSGQDYPLKKNTLIKDYLDGRFPANFIDIFQTPGSWSDHFEPRIKYYKINKSRKRGHFLFLPSIYDKDFYRKETLGKLNFLRKTGRWLDFKNILFKRKFPAPIRPYGGAVYCALPFDTIQHIIAYVDAHPEYLDFHKYTLCADEVFFHSLIMHLQSRYNYQIRPSFTYANWNRKSGPLPVTFEKDDFQELKEASEDYLFARKFDMKIDQEILDKCDENLLR